MNYNIQEQLHDEKDLFYLDTNHEKIQKPLYVRKYMNITNSKAFQKSEYAKIFNKFYDILQENSEKIEENIKTINFTKIIIEWLTISNTKIEINYINTQCKIQLTAKSNLLSTFSIFEPQDLSKTESAIEIFANSKALFKNCHFCNSLRVSVIIRDYSSAIFENCTFEDNEISCFIMEDSYAQFNNCKFKGDKNVSLFVTKNSQCEVNNCEFYYLEGKAIFAKDHSKVYIKNTSFINCNKGAATIVNCSTLSMDGGVTIKNSNNTAIRSIGNSHLKLSNVTIENTCGNAFNIENSDGFIVGCNITKTVYPTIAVWGRKANPIFSNCIFSDNMESFVVICKNGSRPLFDNCAFIGCSTNCFSVSEFSRPHIQNCIFKDIEKFNMNIFSCSIVTYFNIKSDNFRNKIKIAESCKFEEKSIENVRQEDVISNVYDENDEDEHHAKSWKSPSYELPLKITEMDEPEIIKNGQLTSLRKQTLTEITKKTENKEISIVCSKCHDHLHESDEPNIISPCGHIICNKCKDVEKCPICDSQVKGIKKMYFESECTICYDKSSNTMSMPCGHFCMCYECAAKCAEKNFNCPMCNEPMSTYKFLFDDTVHTVIDFPHAEDIAIDKLISDKLLSILENDEIFGDEIKCM